MADKLTDAAGACGGQSDSNPSGSGGSGPDDLDQIQMMFEEIINLSGEELDVIEETLRKTLSEAVQYYREADEAMNETQALNNKLIAEMMEKTAEIEEQIGSTNRDISAIAKERDQALEDLRRVEKAFTEVHTKYELAKQYLLNIKANEEVLKERDEQLQLQVSARDQKLVAFKQEARETVEKVNNDYQEKLTQLDTDYARLCALLRRAEMRVATLDSELEHKKKENGELNKLADELLGKGTNNAM